MLEIGESLEPSFEPRLLIREKEVTLQSVTKSAYPCTG